MRNNTRKWIYFVFGSEGGDEEAKQNVTFFLFILLHKTQRYFIYALSYPCVCNDPTKTEQLLFLEHLNHKVPKNIHSGSLVLTIINIIL